MAKIDEIMEVLTEEISGFNTSLEKLEALSKRLDNLQIQTDTSDLESLLESFLTTQKKTIVSYENRIEQVLKKIEKSRWTPKWEVALLYIVLIINTSAFGYLGYYFINYNSKMQHAVNQAREQGLGKARGYFEDHEVIYKDFQKWVKKKDSIPNQE